MGKMMLLVRYKAKPGTREIYINEVMSSGILQKIREEDGCVSYDYYYDVAEPEEILLVEEWQSEEQQKQHLQTEHMKILKAIKEKYVLETSVRKIMV